MKSYILRFGGDCTCQQSMKIMHFEADFLLQYSPPFKILWVVNKEMVLWGRYMLWSYTIYYIISPFKCTGRKCLKHLLTVQNDLCMTFVLFVFSKKLSCLFFSEIAHLLKKKSKHSVWVTATASSFDCYSLPIVFLKQLTVSSHSMPIFWVLDILLYLN